MVGKGNAQGKGQVMEGKGRKGVSTFKTKINMLNSFATPSISKILHKNRRKKTM
jgi:hypothetical protein